MERDEELLAVLAAILLSNPNATTDVTRAVARAIDIVNQVEFGGSQQGRQQKPKKAA